MNKSLDFPLFVLLMTMCLVWFASCFWLFKRLKNQHPQKYVDMGKPSLFLGNSFANNWRFMRFLWKSEYNSLDDPLLSRTCSFMKIFMAIYLLLFFSVLLFVSSFTRGN